MKKAKFFVYLLYLSSLVILTSCRDNDELTFPDPVLMTNVAFDEYIDFGTDYTYFELKVWNGGEGGFRYSVISDQSWITCKPYLANGEGKTNYWKVAVKRAGQAPGVHSGTILVKSKFGEKTIPVRMEVKASAFYAAFNNTLFTPITLNIAGTTTIIEPQESAYFQYVQNPGTISYYAETSGKTSTGDRIGLKISWTCTEYVSGYTSREWDLITDTDLVFLYITNTSGHSFTPFKVNVGKSTQTTDYIIIPSDGIRYPVVIKS